MPSSIAGATPIPVSFTVVIAVSPSARRSTLIAPPRGVYLIAFDRMF
jgi:hypothetical protein